MKAIWHRSEKDKLIEQLEGVVDYSKNEFEAYKEVYKAKISQMNWFRKLFYTDIYDVEYHKVKDKQYDYYDAHNLLTKVRDSFELGSESITLSEEEIRLTFSYDNR